MHTLLFQLFFYRSDRTLRFASSHLCENVEWLSLTAGYPRKVLVYIGWHFAGPDRRCNNQGVNPRKIGFARFDGRLFCEERFHPAECYVEFFERFDPDQLG